MSGTVANPIGITNPPIDELARRLRSRGTETETQFARRLQTAQEEMASRHEFDVVVVNDDLEAAADRLVALMEI